MQWWPAGVHGFLEYLKPLPAFFSMALPIMFLIDWSALSLYLSVPDSPAHRLNRPKFDRNLQEMLRRPDLVDVTAYYSRSPASGFWFLELDDKFIGLIAIDASKDSTSDDVVMRPKSGIKGRRPSYSKGTSNTATIRHFYVEEPFRVAFAEDDLLEYALKHVFTASPEIQVVRATESALEPYIGKALRKQGFKPLKTLSTIGIFNWEVRLHQLRRGAWHPKGN